MEVAAVPSEENRLAVCGKVKIMQPSVFCARSSVSHSLLWSLGVHIGSCIQG